MKKTSILSFTLATAILALPAMAQDEGKTVFQQHCSHCHAPGGDRPGTLQLGKTRGADNAVLEQRSNLVDVYVKTIVRQGLNGMPPFKPTTITDGQLEALAAYLAPKQ
jgi:mono/diheme cytochrome c family protein